MIAASDDGDGSSSPRPRPDFVYAVAIFVGRRLFLAAVVFGLLLLEVWSNSASSGATIARGK